VVAGTSQWAGAPAAVTRLIERRTKPSSIDHFTIAEYERRYKRAACWEDCRYWIVLAVAALLVAGVVLTARVF